VALAELQTLPGIGPWSAGLVLLRGLRRMDVFPAGDVGAARNLPALLGLSEGWSPADASAFAARFGDRRGYLYFLGLGAQLLSRGLIAPAVDQ
jgi:DNA-3-methyladenine glycosylase II